MAIKQSQYLKLSQKLLPQQILLMKLLQLPTLALEDRVKEELEENPALEEEGESAEEELYNNEDGDDGATEQDDLNDDGEPVDDGLKAADPDVEMEDYMDAEELDSY